MFAQPMQLTKLEHAALILEEAGHRLYIDPGAFTTAITDGTNAVAVVITHEHADHWTPEQLNRIISKSPEVKIYGPSGVVAAAKDFDIIEVKPGDTVNADPFTLRFFGGVHAEIHSSIPLVDNVGVIVNDTLYYPGDSFAVPEGETIDTLAVPAGAPWMKVAEAMDYIALLKPKRAFPTHEMVLSQAGKNLSNARFADMTVAAGGEYFPLEPGETLQL